MNKETIHLYLSGELPDSQIKELLEWAYKNESNRKYFARIKNLWTASRLDHPTPELDLKKEFELLNYRIDKEEQKHTSKYSKALIIGFIRNHWLINFVRVAAILVLSYSIASTYYFVNKTNQIHYNEIATNRGEKSTVQLADGTKIWLNSETKLRYPTNLNTKDVKVYLNGEAYFDVAKNPKRTFIVKASSLDIAVLGTSFNVKSYAEENVIETTLEEGKISISGKMGNMRIKEPVVLRPNQQATFKINSSEISVAEVPGKVLNENKERKNIKEEKSIENSFKPELIIAEQVESKLYTSWKDGKLIFRSERFEDLALRMERWYDVKIQFADEKLKEQKYTGVFEKETLEQALTALSLSYPFIFEIDQNIVLLSSKNNNTNKR